MKNFKHTPLSAAKALRLAFEKHIAKTWDDYFIQQAQRRENPSLQGKFWDLCNFGQLVKEQAKCTSEEASLAMQEVMPELFAEYWDNLYKKSMTKK
jgi:hypothetical protein